MSEHTYARELGRKYDVLKSRAAMRDENMHLISAVRQGRFADAFPSKFGGEWPKPIVANMIDVAARDTAEMLAQMPSFNCSSPNVASDKSRAEAEKKTHAVNYMLTCSQLSVQMFTGADRYVSYGFLPILIEPDYDKKMPRFVVDNPLGAYYEKDRLGNVQLYMRRHLKEVGQLCAEFPELANAIRKHPQSDFRQVSDSAKLEVIYFSDAERYGLFIPERKNLVLQEAVNPLGVCPVVIGERLGLDDQTVGQYDEVLWVQVAKARFAQLALEAATKAVEAPISVPNDMTELVLGPDAIIRSSEPEKIRRVGIEMPQSAFSESASLDRELRQGARYPESRSGDIDASIVTGKGVQALNVGFDSQIKAAQAVFADMFRRMVAIGLEMDEKFWPDVEKKIRGNDKGSPYTVKYKPAKTIGGDYSVDVQYGLMAGLDPNRALVFGLQARSDNLISRDFLRRQMPWDLNVETEERLIDIEGLRDALIQMLQGAATAVPAMAAQGQDPNVIINQLASVIHDRRAGKDLETAVSEAFAPPAAEEIPAEEALGATPGAPAGEPGAGGGLPPGLQASGLMSQVAPGQQAAGPGGQPDMASLLAGLTAGGQPNLQANVQRRQPF